MTGEYMLVLGSVPIAVGVTIILVSMYLKKKVSMYLKKKPEEVEH